MWQFLKFRRLVTSNGKACFVIDFNFNFFLPGDFFLPPFVLTNVLREDVAVWEKYVSHKCCYQVCQYSVKKT